MNAHVAERRTPSVVLILLAGMAVAMAACSSSGSKCSPGGCVSGAAGSAAGASGHDGAVGTAGSSGDAAAGANGAAGSGTDGGAGAAGSVADGGGGADARMCPYGASLGAATVSMQMAAEGGDRSTVSLHDSVAWLGQVDDATRPDVLDVQLYKSAAPFGAMLASMSIPLTGQDDFATCGACVLFHPAYNDGAPLHAQTSYIAKSGTLNVTAVPNGTTMRLTASLSNVTFEHVTIDSSFVTTKADDCTITLTSASIDAPVKSAP